MDENVVRTGGCHCEAVTYTVNGAMRSIVGCHCRQCRKQTGHYFAATNAKKSDLTVQGAEHITIYRASDFASRHFCSLCGSILFWEADDSDEISVLAGSLNEPTGLKLDRHIFCADKGDYYDLDDGLPQFPLGD